MERRGFSSALARAVSLLLGPARSSRDHFAPKAFLFIHLLVPATCASPFASASIELFDLDRRQRG